MDHATINLIGLWILRIILLLAALKSYNDDNEDMSIICGIVLFITFTTNDVF